MSRNAQGAAPVLALVLALTAGCNGQFASKSAPPENSATSSESQLAPDDPSVAPTSAGERTRAMEAKQAEMNRKMEEARTGNLSPEELQQAYQEIEKDRQELNQMGEGAPPPPVEASGAADYPPPPR